jgi:hypothetical protein
MGGGGLGENRMGAEKTIRGKNWGQLALKYDRLARREKCLSALSRVPLLHELVFIGGVSHSDVHSVGTWNSIQQPCELPGGK